MQDKNLHKLNTVEFSGRKTVILLLAMTRVVSTIYLVMTSMCIYNSYGQY